MNVLSLFRSNLAWSMLAVVCLNGVADAQIQAVLSLRTFGWGMDDYGQATVPMPPIPLMRYDEISGGRWHSAAVRDDGVIVCWGRNDAGQCNAPTLPHGVAFETVSCGGWHTLGLRDDGQVESWGRNTDGQCNVPVLPPGLVYTDVAAGGYHSVARRSDGTVVAWGQNYDGQCNVPWLPPGVKYRGISAGLLHTVAHRTDGKIKNWGSDNFGQATAPWMPPGVTAMQVAAGEFHNLAILSDGKIIAWGSNSDRQVEDVPQPLAGSSMSYCDIAAGGAHSVAVRSDGVVLAWGRNVEGQCDPPQVANFIDVAAGGNHTLGRGQPFSASVTPFGTGCPAAQPLTLNSTMPRLGTVWKLTGSQLEQGPGTAVFVFGTQAWLNGYDLGFIGAPGCSVYTNANLHLIVDNPYWGTYANAQIPVPNNIGIVGAQLTAQLVAPSSVTPAGFSTSNGLKITVGF